MPFVVDASATMTWCFLGEATPWSTALLERLKVEGAVVPALWTLEVANTVLVGEQRRRITATQRDEFIQMLEDVSITVVGSLPSAGLGLRERFTLARQFGLTAYDATYLELAMRLRLPLATLDSDLRVAAQQAGVPLL